MSIRRIKTMCRVPYTEERKKVRDKAGKHCGGTDGRYRKHSNIT